MKETFISIILVLLVLLGYSSRFFTIRDRKFYDAKNGQITFHGVNIVQKYSANDFKIQKADIEKLTSWGMNCARVNIIWSALYPEKGKCNETYLKYMVDKVNQLGQNGIYTMIQFHQDLISQTICGNGIPRWMMRPEIYSDFGKPILKPQAVFNQNGVIVNQYQYCRQTKNWQSMQFTYAHNRAYRALYTNQYGFMDQMKLYWRKVTQAFKGNPYIIGFEIINQPWPGNLYKNPLIMIPGLSQVFLLQKFHDQIAKQIRKIDPDQNIGFEPVTWLNAIPTGYSHVPGGKQYASQSFISFHYYKEIVFTSIDMYLGARKLDMKRLGNIGGILSQFMAVSQNDFQYDTQILDKCDKHQISWMGWRYHPTTIPELLTRVYAQRVAGVKVEQQFTPKTALYTLSYESKQQTGQTVIFFSKKIYPNGFILTIEPQTKYEIAGQRFIIIESRLIGNRVVSVKIERANFEGNSQAKIQSFAGNGEEDIMIKVDKNQMREL